MKQKLALLLAVLTLILPLSACASEDTPDAIGTTAAIADTTAAPDTEATDNTDPLPADLRFDGETIRFFSRDHVWCDDEITVEIMTGEVVNDAVYRREQEVEARLGITIENTMSADDELTIASTVKNTILAQTDAFDVVTNAIYATIPLTTQNLFLNLYDIPNLDLDNEWWAQGFNSEMSVGKAQYFMAGDATLSLKRFTFVTTFNKQLFADHGIGKEIYQTVRDRKWTIEYQTTLAAQMYQDLNGNNTVDNEDRFGFGCARYNMSSDPYWSSFELPILKKDADNFYVYAVDVERLDKAVNLINKLWWDDFTVLYPFQSGDLEQDKLASKFASGSLGMMTIRLINLENSDVRNMSDKYGILPIPLLEETQENYYSMAHDQFNIIGIPLTVPAERYAAIGATLEYFACKSRELVTPAYYEIALKTKYANDPESGEMLDIIFAGLKIDAGVIYSQDLKTGVGPHQNLRTLVGENNNNVASMFKVIDKMTPKLLDKLQNTLRENQQ